MKKENLMKMLQIAARDLLKTSSYLEELVMSAYENNGSMPKDEMIGDSKCPEAVQNYLKENQASFSELLMEAKAQASELLANENPLINLKKIRIARLFLNEPEEKLEVQDSLIGMPIVSLIIGEIKLLEEKSVLLDKPFGLAEEDKEVLRRIKFYLN